MDETKRPLRNGTSPGQWLQEHGDYLFRYALSRLRDPEAAEEVVQESFVAALRLSINTLAKARNGLGCWALSSEKSSTTFAAAAVCRLFP